MAGERKNGKRRVNAQESLPANLVREGRLFYAPEDLASDRYIQDLSFPGREPFTRGTDTGMYRTEQWQIRQCISHSSPEDANSSIRYLLANGINSFGLVFDTLTDAGAYPSGIKGRKTQEGGLSVSSLSDMKALLKSISPSGISPCFHVNSAAPQIVSMYMAACASRRAGFETLAGMVQNDPIEDFMTGLITPPDFAVSMELSSALIHYCLDSMPFFRPLCVSGYKLREYGGSEVQEIAFVISSALAHLEEAEKNGIEPERLLSRLSFILGVGTDVPAEIAKFRAARRLWFRIIKTRYPGVSDSLARFEFTARSSDSALAGGEPEINTVRSTMQALAAVLGGARAIHVGYSGGPDSLSGDAKLRHELMLHRIIIGESGVADTIDPAAGSYYVETLTDEMEAKGRSLIRHISGMGGMLNAISSGYVRKEIERNAAETREQMDSGRKYVVGVNILRRGRTSTRTPARGRAVYPSAHRTVSSGSNAPVRKSVAPFLNSIPAFEAGDAGLIPAMVRAFIHGATLGEVTSAVLRRRSD